MTDPVRDFLRRRPSTSFVIEGGLDRLVSLWEATAREVEKGYARTIEEYANDLSRRQILEEVMTRVAEDAWRGHAPRIRAADARFRAATTVRSESVLGPGPAVGWRLPSSWWFYSWPLRRQFAG